MKITLIMLTKNSVSNLPATLASLHDQTYNNWELIVQDCLSEDGTAASFLNETDKRIGFISERDEGLYDGLNRAMKRVTGDIVGVLHSDDMLYDCNTLKTVASTFADNLTEVVYGNVEFVRQFDDRNPVRIWRAGHYSPQRLRYGWMPPHTSTFIKTSLLGEVGGYRTDYRIAGDYDFLVRVLKLPKLKIKYIDQTVCRMKLGGLSTEKSLKRLTNVFFEDYRVVKENKIGGLSTVVLKKLRKIHQSTRLLTSFR
jgi:glycosyltransferase involved in cell wall biosynthesis